MGNVALLSQLENVQISGIVVEKTEATTDEDLISDFSNETVVMNNLSVYGEESGEEDEDEVSNEEVEKGWKIVIQKIRNVFEHHPILKKRFQSTKFIRQLRKTELDEEENEAKQLVISENHLSDTKYLMTLLKVIMNYIPSIEGVRRILRGTGRMINVYARVYSHTRRLPIPDFRFRCHALSDLEQIKHIVSSKISNYPPQLLKIFHQGRELKLEELRKGCEFLEEKFIIVKRLSMKEMTYEMISFNLHSLGLSPLSEAIEQSAHQKVLRYSNLVLGPKLRQKELEERKKKKSEEEEDTEGELDDGDEVSTEDDETENMETRGQQQEHDNSEMKNYDRILALHLLSDTIFELLPTVENSEKYEKVANVMNLICHVLIPTDSVIRNIESLEFLKIEKKKFTSILSLLHIFRVIHYKKYYKNEVWRKRFIEHEGIKICHHWICSLHFSRNEYSAELLSLILFIINEFHDHDHYTIPTRTLKESIDRIFRTISSYDGGGNRDFMTYYRRTDLEGNLRCRINFSDRLIQTFCHLDQSLIFLERIIELQNESVEFLIEFMIRHHSFSFCLWKIFAKIWNGGFEQVREEFKKFIMKLISKSESIETSSSNNPVPVGTSLGSAMDMGNFPMTQKPLISVMIDTLITFLDYSLIYGDEKKGDVMMRMEKHKIMSSSVVLIHFVFMSVGWRMKNLFVQSHVIPKIQKCIKLQPKIKTTKSKEEEQEEQEEIEGEEEEDDENENQSNQQTTNREENNEREVIGEVQQTQNEENEIFLSTLYPKFLIENCLNAMSNIIRMCHVNPTYPRSTSKYAIRPNRNNNDYNTNTTKIIIPHLPVEDLLGLCGGIDFSSWVISKISENYVFKLMIHLCWDSVEISRLIGEQLILSFPMIENVDHFIGELMMLNDRVKKERVEILCDFFLNHMISNLEILAKEETLSRTKFIARIGCKSEPIRNFLCHPQKGVEKLRTITRKYQWKLKLPGHSTDTDQEKLTKVILQDIEEEEEKKVSRKLLQNNHRVIVNMNPSSSSEAQEKLRIVAFHLKNMEKTFTCPITHTIMKDPVILVESNQTYEREAIERWLDSNETDPMTRLKLQSKRLLPNLNLRQVIDEWEKLQNSM